ncbi:MAG TPA: ATP-binding protein [Candidatus Coprenecus pullistercoris]|nr:ATP-binding protein [Candidatus Coprenecus pullistercoris]
MNDLSMHILDIVQNSVSAGATRVTLTVDEAPATDMLTIVIGDNGKGMTAEQVSRLADPFFTSRTTRKVGMGIPLLKQSAEQSGGEVRITSEPGRGTEVTAVFGYSNIDRPPLGDVANALMLLVSSNPDMDFLFTYRYDGEEYVLDTADVREVFGKDALRDLTIVRNIEEMIKDNMREIRNC